MDLTTDFPLLRQVADLQARPMTEEQVGLIQQFVGELYQRNEVMNLTRVPVEECDLKHLADSLLVSEFVSEGAGVLDIGPGPGFPSWVLACSRHDVSVTAVESQGKMARMLTAVPLANLKLLEQRAEDDVRRESFDFVTGRAVAPFAVQAEISAAWLRKGGLFVPFRTPAEGAEIEGFNAGVLGLELDSMEERSLGDTEIVRLFPVFRKVRSTPAEFPRSWGRIKSRPLA